MPRRDRMVLQAMGVTPKHSRWEVFEMAASDTYRRAEKQTTEYLIPLVLRFWRLHSHVAILIL
jgi:hypothetical protein